MRKTEVQYAQEAYDLFKWLVKNPKDNRFNYPGIEKLRKYICTCPACEYTKKKYGHDFCPEKCPIRTACEQFCLAVAVINNDGSISIRRIVRKSCKNWLYRAKKRAEKK